jgi:hypothetical protein
MNQELIDTLRKMVPNIMAEELCEVQPMDDEIFTHAMVEGKSEKWLIENGYELVDSQTRLMWVKKDGNNT